MARRLRDEGHDVINLHIGDVCCPPPPNVVEEGIRRYVGSYPSDIGDLILKRVSGQGGQSYPRGVVERSVRAMERTPYTTYAGMAGVPELKEAIAKYLNRTRFGGRRVIEPRGVIPTVGAACAAWSALLTYADAGDGVILQDPGYSAFWEQVTLAGCRPVYVPLEEGGWSWDPEGVESGVEGTDAKVMLFSSPNNPTGSVLDRDRLEGLAGVAERHDMLILSDETYDRIYYDGHGHESIASVDGMMERTLIIGSFSKVYAMTGERLGYIAGKPELVIPVSQAQHKCALYPSQITQYAGVVALEDPQTEVWLDRRLQEYIRRRDALVEGFAGVSGVTCVKPVGAIYVFPNISAISPSSEEFAYRLLSEACVQVAPGIGFGPTGEGHIRISFGPVGLRRLEEGVGRIRGFVEKNKILMREKA